MLEASHYTTTACPIARLADEAVNIIDQLGTCDLAMIDQLLKLETSASENMAMSREGALFQLAIVNAHADTLLSYIPQHLPEFARLEATYEEVRKLLYSVAKLLQDELTDDDAIENYYFAVDPFEAH